LANQTDFLDLYETLGLDPGCGLAEFKLAYRQHVAVHHPDRPAEAPARLEAVEAAPLQEVIAQYGAAMEFHRRHGRLPGAAMPPPRFTVSSKVVAADSGSRPVRPLGAPQAAPRRRSKALVLLGMIAIGVLLWNVAPPSWLAETPSMLASTDQGAEPRDAPTRTVLYVGMSAQDVRILEGDPQVIHENRWDYGGSWVRFDHGKVVDWYSSVLHPLKTVDHAQEVLH